MTSQFVCVLRFFGSSLSLVFCVFFFSCSASRLFGSVVWWCFWRPWRRWMLSPQISGNFPAFFWWKVRSIGCGFKSTLFFSSVFGGRISHFDERIFHTPSSFSKILGGSTSWDHCQWMILHDQQKILINQPVGTRPTLGFAAFQVGDLLGNLVGKWWNKCGADFPGKLGVWYVPNI